MAVVGAPFGYTRRVALRGLYTVTSLRGTMVVTAWPSGHRARPKKTELARREWLRNIVLATNYMDPGTAAEINDTLLGSAMITRDFKTQLLAGTAFGFRMTDGVLILPVQYRQKLWNSLDAVRAAQGMMHTRYGSTWSTIVAGVAGTRLTSNGVGATPSWQ